MDLIYEKIETLIANAKKSLSKAYALETIQAKREEVERLQKKVEKILADTEITDEIRLAHTKRFNDLKKDAIDILETHANKGKVKDIPQLETEKIVEMALTNLNASDLASYSKLLPVFNGFKEELNSFVANLEILRETVTEEKQNAFFNFVFKTRLTQKVQNRVKQGAVPTNIIQLISELKRAYKIKKSPNTLLNELTRIVQTDSIRKFSDRIETLITELNEIQIGELGEGSRTSIITANETIAFNAFKNGLKNREVSRTIEASRTKSFAEAVEIAEETSSDMKQSQIMFQSAQRGNKGNDWRGKNFNQIQSNCRKCGQRHGDKCPANEKKCYSCNGFNHFSSVCFKNKNYGNHNNNNNNGYNGNRGNYRSTFNSGNKGNNSNYRGNNSYRNNNSYHNKNNNRSNNYGNNKNQKVHHVQEQGNSRSPEVVDYRESLEQKQKK